MRIAGLLNQFEVRDSSYKNVLCVTDQRDGRTGIFPDLVVDACLSIYTAEYVELLPEFLANLCRAARQQVLMVCRPIDKENHERYRFFHPFVVDFTEDFLIDSMKRNGFHLRQFRTYPDNRAVVLYDFISQKRA